MINYFQRLEEAVLTSDIADFVTASATSGKENEKDLNVNQTKYNAATVQSTVFKNKKKTPKTKHKKYEKPSDQVIKHYKCTHCPKVFQRVSNFNAHQRKHTARPFSCLVSKSFDKSYKSFLVQ